MDHRLIWACEWLTEKIAFPENYSECCFFFFHFRQLDHSVEPNDDESKLIQWGKQKIKVETKLLETISETTSKHSPPLSQMLTTFSSAQKKKEKACAAETESDTTNVMAKNINIQSHHISKLLIRHVSLPRPLTITRFLVPFGFCN